MEKYFVWDGHCFGFCREKMSDKEKEEYAKQMKEVQRLKIRKLMREKNRVNVISMLLPGINE